MMGIEVKNYAALLFIFSMLSANLSLAKSNPAAGDLLLFEINNPTPGMRDEFGFSVAAAPDGNLLVGAHSDNTSADNAGSAYFFDGATGDLLLTLNNPTPEPDDAFGFSVATTPDGNLLVGAFLDNTGTTDAGSVYLFDPATCDGTDGTVDQVCNIPDLTISNPTPEVGDAFGLSVAATPDGNILAGAHGDNTGADGAGSAYLFDPATCDGADGAVDQVCNIPDLTTSNPTPDSSDSFGAFVATTLDGNILVGAYDNLGTDNAGAVHLFDGTTGELLLTLNNPTPELNDYFSSSIAATADGNILVGAYRDNTGADSAGSAYLFDPVTCDGADGTIDDVCNVADLTIYNPTPEELDVFGGGWRSIAATPDGNFFIGAAFDNTGATLTGSAYLFADDLVEEIFADGFETGTMERWSNAEP